MMTFNRSSLLLKKLLFTPISPLSLFKRSDPGLTTPLTITALVLVAGVIWAKPGPGLLSTLVWTKPNLTLSAAVVWARSSAPLPATFLWTKPTSPRLAALNPVTRSLTAITDPWTRKSHPAKVINKLGPRLAHYLSPDSMALLDPMAAPVASALAHLNRNRELRKMVARAIIQESVRQKVSPSLILAIISVENNILNPRARSRVGAKGLMQVMPFHAGRLGCRSSDLEAIDSNICHGVRVFAYSLKAKKGDINKALLAYNGCVKGTNTPKCRAYPRRVLAAEARARTRMAAARVALDTRRTE